MQRQDSNDLVGKNTIGFDKGSNSHIGTDSPWKRSKLFEKDPKLGLVAKGLKGPSTLSRVRSFRAARATPKSGY